MNDKSENNSVKDPVQNITGDNPAQEPLHDPNLPDDQPPTGPQNTSPSIPPITSTGDVQNTPSLMNTTLPVPPDQPPSSPPGQGKSVKPMMVIAGILVGITAVILGLLFVTQKLGEKPQNSQASGNSQAVGGQLVIGTDATYPPMEYFDEEGNLVGYDIDLGFRIAEKLNRNAEFKVIAWDDIFTALENEEIDIILSSVSITDERKLKYDFSNPYLNAGQVIITRKDNETISSTDDLNDKKIAVQKDTTNELEALKYTSEDLVIRYDDFIDATNALVEGEADAIFSDLTNAKGIINKYASLQIVSEPFTQEYYGVVLKKGSNLTSEVNAVLNSLRQQGVPDYLKQKWLE